MQLDRHASLRREFVLGLTFVFAVWLLIPGSALAQTATPTTPQPTQVATATTQATAQATAQPTTAAPALTLSESKAAAGTSITANGSGFKSGETVDVTFNGQNVGSPKAADNGSFSLSFTVPDVPVGTYGVLATGRDSGLSASTNFEIVAGAATVRIHGKPAARQP